MSDEDLDKKALLDELKIDRSEDVDSARPIKWFVAVAVVAAVGVLSVVYGVPFVEGERLSVQTVMARVPASAAARSSVLEATGYVVARRIATVSSKTTGKVVEVMIEEGMVVGAGELLATLDDSIPRARYELSRSQLAAAEARIAELDVSIRQAKLDLDRTQNLAARELASQADLDRASLDVEALLAALARAESEIAVAERSMAIQSQELEDMSIRAPFAGVVIAKAAQPGEMISPISAGGGFTRTGICTIVDMDSLEVEVDVNERYINRVFERQPVTVNLNAYPDDDIAAEVIAIIPTADRNKATVRVRIGFLERDARILPDMGVKVSFQDDGTTPVAARPNGVIVPRTSVRPDGNKNYVWVVRDDLLERRLIVGRSEPDGFRVTEGLDRGERVVASLDGLDIASLHGKAVTIAN